MAREIGGPERGFCRLCTGIWLIQYTVLADRFFSSLRMDCRSRGTCKPNWQRTLIQLCGLLHAVFGMVVELSAMFRDSAALRFEWSDAIDSRDSAAEASLKHWTTIWSTISMFELVSNLLISLLMGYRYSQVYRSLGDSSWWSNATIWRVQWLWNILVFIWAACYIIFYPTQGQNNYVVVGATAPTGPAIVGEPAASPSSSPAPGPHNRLTGMILDKLSALSVSYYFMNVFLELWCLVLARAIRAAAGHAPVGSDLRSAEREATSVVVVNKVACLDAFFLLLVHIPPLQLWISSFWAEWHGWVLCCLFFVRYFTICSLIEPAAGHMADALRLGPLPPYRFDQGGVGLVICNTCYTEDSSMTPLLGNEKDAEHFEALFKLLGFRTTIRCDLSSNDMQSELSEIFKEAAGDDVHGLAIAFSGHGGLDCILGVDGKPVYMEEHVLAHFSGELVQKHIPKLFFLDCCRGESSEIRRASQNVIQQVRLSCGKDVPSVHVDCLYCYLTARGYVAHSGPDGVGVLASSLHAHVDELLEQNSAFDLEDAIKKVTKEVSCRKSKRCHMQTPKYESTLTRRFIVKQRRGRHPPPYSMLMESRA